MTTEETIEALATFEAWRETTLMEGPDVSLTAYIKVLEAGQVDPRIAEVHERAKSVLEGAGANRATLMLTLVTIAEWTQPEVEPTELEAFKF